MRILVLGLGNPVLTDDAVGWQVAGLLEGRLEGRPGVEVDRCCRGGLDLMERMVGYDRVLVVDAIRTGAAPGTIHRLSPEQLPTRNSSSAHDASLATALALGRRLGARLPAAGEILLFGVEAADTETFSETCTAPVRVAIPLVVEMVEAALERERSESWR